MSGNPWGDGNQVEGRSVMDMAVGKTQYARAPPSSKQGDSSGIYIPGSGGNTTETNDTHDYEDDMDATLRESQRSAHNEQLSREQREHKAKLQRERQAWEDERKSQELARREQDAEYEAVDPEDQEGAPAGKPKSKPKRSPPRKPSPPTGDVSPDGTTSWTKEMHRHLWIGNIIAACLCAAIGIVFIPLLWSKDDTPFRYTKWLAWDDPTAPMVEVFTLFSARVSMVAPICLLITAATRALSAILWPFHFKSVVSGDTVIFWADKAIVEALTKVNLLVICSSLDLFQHVLMAGVAIGFVYMLLRTITDATVLADEDGEPIGTCKHFIGLSVALILFLIMWGVIFFNFGLHGTHAPAYVWVAAVASVSFDVFFMVMCGVRLCRAQGGDNYYVFEWVWLVQPLVSLTTLALAQYIG